jgi:hypothetical protein
MSVLNKIMRKRDTPDYANLTGWINPEIAQRFKQHCLRIGIDYSTALEIVVSRWLAKTE